MTDAKAAWSETGERLSGLAARLKAHYEQQSGDEGAQAKQELKDAAKRLGEAVESAFEALGAAAKDPAVKADVKQVGHSLTTALNASFAGISEDVRKAFEKRTSGGSPWSGATDRPDGADGPVPGAPGGGTAGETPPEQAWGTPPPPAPPSPVQDEPGGTPPPA